MNDFYRVLGVMSGTSLDGVDLAVCTFQFSGTHVDFAVEQATTLDYPAHWKRWLATAHDLESDELQQLDQQYTRYLAATINNFKQEHDVTNLDAVCSHGHTVLHQPHRGITVQIGNQPQLADLVGCRVVCDFRVQDVALGGQGAPLVPIGDALLFPHYAACINLGGFANISYPYDGLGADSVASAKRTSATSHSKNRLAYDICPVNIVMNDLARELGSDYDDDGAFAKAGTCNPTLLAQLNSLSFYQKLPPKSLGKEWVIEYIEPLIVAAKVSGTSTRDLLATMVAHITEQIARVLRNVPMGRVLVTGGGAFNGFLIAELERQTAHQIIVPDARIVNYKEALIFGLLGVLRLRGAVNCLASVTGASRDHSSGKVYQPS